MKHKLVAAIIATILLIISAYLGYLFRDRKAAFEIYDGVLSKLGSDIYMLDALDADKTSDVKSMLVASIEGDVAEMVWLYNQYAFAESDYGRCVVTRKVRSLYDRKLALTTDSNGRYSDYPLSEVIDYLKTTCEGQPSHENWSEVDKKNAIK